MDGEMGSQETGRQHHPGGEHRDADVHRERSAWGLLRRKLTGLWGVEETEKLCRALARRREELSRAPERDFLGGLMVGLDILEEEVGGGTFPDLLTGAFSRLQFLEFAEREFYRAQRHGVPLAVLLLDLDRFKQVNLRFGRAVGDEVLRHVTSLWRRCMRGEDVLGRLDGEEFVVLLPETDLAGAMTLGERLRRLVEACPLDKETLRNVASSEALADGELSVTVSVGVAVFREGDTCVNALLERGNRALARAMRQGMNRVEAHGA